MALRHALEPWARIVVLAVIVSGFGCSTLSSARAITRTKAITIALEEAHRLNVVLENYPVMLYAEDEYSAPHRWRKSLDGDHELARRLQGKPYWAVYIRPITHGIAVTGGTRVVVLIDATNGAVLGRWQMRGDFD